MSHAGRDLVGHGLAERKLASFQRIAASPPATEHAQFLELVYLLGTERIRRAGFLSRPRPACRHVD
jgi:hypothetical protein